MTLIDLLRGFIGHNHSQVPSLGWTAAAIVIIAMLFRMIRRIWFLGMMTPERLPALPAQQVHAGRQCAGLYLVCRLLSTLLLLAVMLSWTTPQLQPWKQYFVPAVVFALGLLAVSLWLQSQALPVVRDLAAELRAEREVARLERLAELEREGEELDRIARSGH